MTCLLLLTHDAAGTKAKSGRQSIITVSASDRSVILLLMQWKNGSNK